MGGLIKYVTKDPSVDAMSGRIEAGANSVANGPQLGFTLRGTGNLPLSDDSAVRASAFMRQDPGYITNVATGQQGVNRSQTYGGRLAFLWAPNSDLSLKLSAIYQSTKSDGSSNVDVPTPGFPRTTGLGDLQQNYLPATGWISRTNQAYSATLQYKLGDVDLVSVTGYNETQFNDSFDVVDVFAIPTTYNDRYFGQKFTEELRLSGSFWQDFDWLAGGYYTLEHAHNYEFVNTVNATTGAPTGQIYSDDRPFNYREYAVFGDLTYHFDERFDVQLGLRDTQYMSSRSLETETEPTILTPGSKSSANAYTYLLTPRFQVTPDLMVYARLASGYRPGALSSNAAIAVGAPASVGPEKTHNYEIGMKGDFFDHILSVDLSAFYEEYKNIQVAITTPAPRVVTYSVNAGGAKSEGVELAATLRPAKGTTLSGWFAYANAVITEGFPTNSALFARPGDPLPNNAEYSANASVNQDFELGDGVDGFAAASVAYIGDRTGFFGGMGVTRADLPAYTKLNFSAGLRFASWTATVYLNNATDARGLVNSRTGNNLFPYAKIIIPPRTVGLTLSQSF
jgi:outer membrane receptor protein involved in Fe transport